MLYLLRGVSQVFLREASLPIMITEGEFKTLRPMAPGESRLPGPARFLPLGVSGVYNWRGKIHL
jgi:hypothetical protein